MPATIISHFLPFRLPTVLFGLYDYLLPIMLYCAWSTLAFLDLARTDRATEADQARAARWAFLVVAVPALGAILYFVAGRPALSRTVWLGAVVGGALVVLAAYGITFVQIG